MARDLKAAGAEVCAITTSRRETLDAALDHYKEHLGLAVRGYLSTAELIATEDYDLWLRMSAKEPIAYSSRPMTFYRVHSGSLSANSRFLRGIEKIMSRIAEQHEGEAHFHNLIKRRRAGARLDLAWDMIAEGRAEEARELIREAQKLAPTWKGLKMRLRSYLKR